jgi:hypothetical protein
VKRGGDEWLVLRGGKLLGIRMVRLQKNRGAKQGKHEQLVLPLEWDPE